MHKVLRYITIVLLIALAVGCGGQNGNQTQTVSVAIDKPELADLAAALAHYGGADVTVIKPVVSRVDPGYVSVRYRACIANCEVTNSLLHRVRRTWQQSIRETAVETVLYSYNPGEWRGYACPFAPRRTIEGLYGIICPSAYAIHAEPVLRTQYKSLRNAYREGVNARGIKKSELDLRRACISHLDKSWVGAQGLYQTGLNAIAFFHKGKNGWKLDRNEPREVAMSLETCVGFNGQ